MLLLPCLKQQLKCLQKKKKITILNFKAKGKNFPQPTVPERVNQIKPVMLTRIAICIACKHML